MDYNRLSDEQKLVIQKAEEGKNVFVDACIGSGKTTMIQALCERIPDKKILYLTYSRLLKEDAKNKIKIKHVDVANYHGFAVRMLKKNKIRASVSESIQMLIKSGIAMPEYDLLVIDEYQDIEQEFAEMLDLIKNANPSIQIVMVGDFSQKIGDKTVLDVCEFSKRFLDEYEKMNLTKCFRLNKDYALQIGMAWEKTIVGVNRHQRIERMTIDEVVEFLSTQKPSDVLCLGQRAGKLNKVLNRLESEYPSKFNKRTVYASIKSGDGVSNVIPNKNSAIFTTYDSSKGLERSICVVFDFVPSYWVTRAKRQDVDLKILRNVFCVAISRGKDLVVFVDDPGRKNESLSEIRDLKTYCEKSFRSACEPFYISEMFNHKYIEDVEECYRLLQLTPFPPEDDAVIGIRGSDCLIDLSPCIGIYQEASFFANYNIDEEIKMAKEMHRDKAFRLEKIDGLSIDQKILALTAFETDQDRYYLQVELPLVTEEEKHDLHGRLRELFDGNEMVQVDCSFPSPPRLSVRGRIDVMKANCIFELKFVSELQHTHFLQLACYLVAMNKEKGFLWNTKKNEMWRVCIPNRKEFIRQVIWTITKRKCEWGM